MTPSSYMRKRSYQPSSRTFSVLPVSVFERRLLPKLTLRMLNANQQKPSCQVKFILRNTIHKSMFWGFFCVNSVHFLNVSKHPEAGSQTPSPLLFSLMGEAVSKSWFQDFKDSSSRTLEYHSCRLVSGCGRGLGMGGGKEDGLQTIFSSEQAVAPQRGTCRWIGASVAQQLWAVQSGSAAL